MAEYDQLPKELRHWLAAAQLPWSPRSVNKLWQKALRKHSGKPSAALEFMSACEANLIKKDAPAIWGASYPQ